MKGKRELTLLQLLSIALVSIVQTSNALWRPAKLESCELHPDIEARILKDVGYWADRGITEPVATSVCRFCDFNQPRPRGRRSAARSLSSTSPRHTATAGGALPATGLRGSSNQRLQAQSAHSNWQQGSGATGASGGGGAASAAAGTTVAGDCNTEAAVASGARGRASGDIKLGHGQQRPPPARQQQEEEEEDDPADRQWQEQDQGPSTGLPAQRRLQQHFENCNKPQRVLIQNGTVYLNNLVAESWLGPFEHIGFLLELYEASQVFRLPDVEFTYWFGDNAPAHTIVERDGSSKWPYAPGAMPAVAAWSKWNENAALVVPYSGAFRCPQDSWDALESQLETAAGLPWEQRREVAFGRWNAFCTHYIPWMKTADGEVMKCPRTHLATLAAQHPDLLDTSYLSVLAKPVPLLHQNANKYIVSTDGWSISSKFDKYLLLGSTVLKAESTRYGFYYGAIKPYTHYLPFMVNTSEDILEVVAWAKAHDREARQIAEEARRFALRNLNRRARLCYLFRLMTELSKKLGYQPSCRRRQLCVPLVQEVHFLARHERTRKSCRYHEVLLRYGDDDADGTPGQPVDTGASTAPEEGAGWQPRGTTASGAPYYSYDDLLRLHTAGTTWPRDDLGS